MGCLFHIFNRKYACDTQIWSSAWFQSAGNKLFPLPLTTLYERYITPVLQCQDKLVTARQLCQWLCCALDHPLKTWDSLIFGYKIECNLSLERTVICCNWTIGGNDRLFSLPLQWYRYYSLIKLLLYSYFISGASKPPNVCGPQMSEHFHLSVVHYDVSKCGHCFRPFANFTWFVFIRYRSWNIPGPF